MRDLLTGDARDHALAPLTARGWTLEADGKAITRTYRFKGFPAALGFMVAAGTEAQKLDHHPEWTNVYNRVEVRLTTHSAGGLTDLDIRLADVMDSLAP
jgi:4a-hydroxytetrahydrobiopterin dehydratase